MTQTARLIAFLRTHPGATTMELQLALRPFVSNPRARISDLREQGVVIDCERRSDGQRGYYVRVPRPVDAGETYCECGALDTRTNSGHCWVCGREYAVVGPAYSGEQKVAWPV